MNRTLGSVVAVIGVVSCKHEPATKAEVAVTAAPPRAADPAPPPADAAPACRPTEPAVPDEAGLAFLNDVGGTLDVELTEATVGIAPGTKLENRKAPPTATIKSMKLDAYRFVDDEEVPLTDAELQRVVFRGAVLRLQGLGKMVVLVEDDCVYTVHDVLGAVEETERQTRGESEWFGGVDAHHVFFEGLERVDGGVWQIDWGS